MKLIITAPNPLILSVMPFVSPFYYGIRGFVLLKCSVPPKTIIKDDFNVYVAYRMVVTINK